MTDSLWLIVYSKKEIVKMLKSSKVKERAIGIRHWVIISEK